MRRNLKGISDYIKGTIPLYFPDEFNGINFRMKRKAIHWCSHAQDSPSLHAFLHCLLKLAVAKSLRSNVKVRDLSRLSHRKHDQPCWARFPGSEKLDPSRNGRMAWNFLVIRIFPNFRPTSRGTSKTSKIKFRKTNVYSIHSPARNFRNVWSNRKRP